AADRFSPAGSVPSARSEHRARWRLLVYELRSTSTLAASMRETSHPVAVSLRLAESMQSGVLLRQAATSRRLQVCFAFVGMITIQSAISRPVEISSPVAGF